VERIGSTVGCDPLTVELFSCLAESGVIVAPRAIRPPAASRYVLPSTLTPRDNAARLATALGPIRDHQLQLQADQ
jgi:hypothetical protein